jgi:hypothetical protein
MVGFLRRKTNQKDSAAFKKQTMLSRDISLVNPHEPRMNSVDIEIEKTFVSLTTKARHFEDVARWISNQGQNYAVYSSLKDVLLALEGFRGLTFCILIDIDSFGEIYDVFDAIRRIRDHFTDVPLILASHYFSTSNFETDRLITCDVSLRLPITFNHFELALSKVALINQFRQDRMLTNNMQL